MSTRIAVSHAKEGTWVVRYKRHGSDTAVRVTIGGCPRQEAIKKSRALLSPDVEWEYVGAQKAQKR